MAKKNGWSIKERTYQDWDTNRVGRLRFWRIICLSRLGLHLWPRSKLYQKTAWQFITGRCRRRYIDAPRIASSIGAALMSSAKGNGTRWRPAGSFHPPSSTFSPCRQSVIRFVYSLKKNEKRTWGKRAQNAGDAFLLVRVRTKPIFFFLIIVFKRALKVRLLPE